MTEVSFWTGPAAAAKLRAMLPYIHRDSIEITTSEWNARYGKQWEDTQTVADNDGNVPSVKNLEAALGLSDATISLLRLEPGRWEASFHQADGHGQNTAGFDTVYRFNYGKDPQCRLL